MCRVECNKCFAKVMVAKKNVSSMPTIPFILIFVVILFVGRIQTNVFNAVMLQTVIPGILLWDQCLGSVAIYVIQKTRLGGGLIKMQMNKKCEFEKCVKC